MAVIQIKYATVTGHVPSGLQPGQLAINIADGILFWNNNAAALQNFNFANPQVPTLGGSDDSLHAANTAFVQGLIRALIGSAPGGLNTLQELASAINNDANFAQTINNVLSSVIRFDQVQGLNGTQIAQVLSNIGFSSAIIDGGTF